MANNTWFNNLSAEEALTYVEDSPFGKDWEGNFLELTPLKWNPSDGTLVFFDGRYHSIVQFQPSYSIKYIGDNNPLNMVEAAIARSKGRHN